jgi:hypothetical protein
LSLNPSQISGACGRLMCCLRYEHEFYVHSRKKFPKEGKTVTTAKGEEKVVSNDIFNERVMLRSAEGETRVIALAAFRAELDGGDAVADLSVSAEAPELAEIDEILPDTGTYAATIAARAVLAVPPAPPAPPPPPPSEEPAAPTAGPKKRRRGRRGGRRGRGKGGGSAPPTDDEAPTE